MALLLPCSQSPTPTSLDTSDVHWSCFNAQSKPPSTVTPIRVSDSAIKHCWTSQLGGHALAQFDTGEPRWSCYCCPAAKLPPRCRLTPATSTGCVFEAWSRAGFNNPAPLELGGHARTQFDTGIYTDGGTAALQQTSHPQCCLTQSTCTGRVFV